MNCCPTEQGQERPRGNSECSPYRTLRAVALTIPPENRPAITRVIIGFGHRADAANLADAAGMRNVGLRR
jgi:hypothetical protein